jgi:hypothetical protein
MSAGKVRWKWKWRNRRTLKSDDKSLGKYDKKE